MPRDPELEPEANGGRRLLPTGPPVTEELGGRRAAIVNGASRIVGPTTDGWLIRCLAVVIGAILTVYLVRNFQAYHHSEVANFDEFAIWSKKAFALYYLDGLDPNFFSNPSLNTIHLEYPLLLPLLEAFVYRGMGQANDGLGHAELLIVFVAAVWTLGWIVARERRNWYWLPILIALGVSPFAHGQQATGLADVTMACFGGLGVLAMGQWLLHGERNMLMLGALFLGASANTKFEGLIVAVVAFVICGFVLLVGRQPRRLGTLVVAGVVLAVLVLPWRIWVAAHPQITSFFDAGRTFQWSDYMWPNRGLVRTGLQLLDQQVADPTGLLFLVPLAIAMGLMAILTGIDRMLALFYALVGAGVVSAIVWIYWINPASWSANRVISAPVLVAVAGLLHLAARTSLLRSAASDGLAEDRDERLPDRRPDHALQA